MKKIFFNVTACICAGLLFAGCNKEDNSGDGVIQATAVSLPSGIKADEVDIDKVYVEVVARGHRGYYDEVYEIAEGDYDKGRFILNLPLIVEDRHLRPIVDGLSGGVQVSDVNAKFVSFVDIGAISTNRGNARVGSLLYGKENSDGDERMEFWYVAMLT